MRPSKIYGLIGYPTKHSLSPVMHNAAFSALKINAEYRLFELKSQDLGCFLESLTERNIHGLNVTIPYKEKAIEYLDGYKSFGVRTIGAVNTIVIGREGRLKGFNTDYLGFSRHMSELKLKPKRVAIIGAGGAAKAVCFTLAKKDIDEFYVYDVDKNKSLDLARRFQPLFSKCKFLAVDSIEGLKIKNKDMLINASGIGMNKKDPCLVDASMLYTGLFVYDLIYNPAQTKLLKLAKDKGCRYSNGLGMLLYQGVASLNLWIKPKKAPVEIMRQALMDALYK